MGESRKTSRWFVNFTGVRNARERVPESVGEDTIQRLCRQVSEEIESVTDRAVGQIRAELQSYAAVPIEEQRGYIRRQLAATLRALAESEPLADDVLERSRQLGRRRAMQGLPLSDVIETYHIASRELWNTMVATAAEPTTTCCAQAA